MGHSEISCIRSVGREKICSYCQGKLIKYGKTKHRTQRFRCKKCNKTQVENYTYNAYQPNLNRQIVVLTKEGLGIRSTARVLGISTTTLLKRILSIAGSIPRPAVIKGKIYEVDEMKTFLGNKNKKIWIAYALERESKKVVSFYVGARTNKTLKAVLKTLFFSKAKRIYTHGLRNYPYLIKKEIYRVTRFGTVHLPNRYKSSRHDTSGCSYWVYLLIFYQMF